MVMINLKEIEKMDRERTVDMTVKNVFYTNPALLSLPYHKNLVEFFVKRLKTDNISFFRAIVNYYYMGHFLNNNNLSIEDYNNINSGVSMSELTHLLTSTYSAYINICLSSIINNDDDIFEMLVTSSNNMNFQFLEISYEEYRTLETLTNARKNKELTEDLYNTYNDDTKKFVDNAIFVSSSLQKSEKVH